MWALDPRVFSEVIIGVGGVGLQTFLMPQAYQYQEITLQVMKERQQSVMREPRLGMNLFGMSHCLFTTFLQKCKLDLSTGLIRIN